MTLEEAKLQYAWVKTPLQAVEAMCGTSPDIAAERETMESLLGVPAETLDAMAEAFRNRRAVLKERASRVERMRSPYRGRQTRRPTFQSRRRRLLGRLDWAMNSMLRQAAVHWLVARLVSAQYPT